MCVCEGVFCVCVYVKGWIGLFMCCALCFVLCSLFFFVDFWFLKIVVFLFFSIKGKKVTTVSDLKERIIL